MEERLTTNNGGGHYLDLSDNPFSYDEIVCKLGAFEDFMEEVGAESLDELEGCIVDLNKEIQELKDRWEKFKEFINEDKHYELVTEDVAYGYKNCILSIKNKIQELEQE
jgi:hypothetical protein